MTHAKLQGLTKLSESVTIYVPTTYGTSDTAAEWRVNFALKVVQRELAQLFGGFTTTEGTGGYVAENGELVTERVYMVRANAAKLTEDDIGKAVLIAELVRDDMKQECVSLDINGTLYFV